MLFKQESVLMFIVVFMLLAWFLLKGDQTDVVESMVV